MPPRRSNRRRVNAGPSKRRRIDGSPERVGLASTETAATEDVHLHSEHKGTSLETRPESTAKDKVSNIEKWTDAFLIFSSIYLKGYPNKLQELLQYMSIIREAASRSSTLSWRSYDEQLC